MTRVFRGVAALVLWIALALQYALLLNHPDAPGAIGATLNFFSFFTILTNIVVAVAMSAPAFWPSSGLARFFENPATRSAVTLYILVVGVVYHAALRELWSPQGWQALADNLLHYASPALMALDWLFVTRKEHISLRAPAAWLAYPVGYVVYILIRGKMIGRYPYPFLDVAVLGWPQTLANIAGLTAAFLAGGVLLALAGRAVPYPR